MCAHTYMYIYTVVLVCTYIHVPVCTHTYMYVYIHTCTNRTQVYRHTLTLYSVL